MTTDLPHPVTGGLFPSPVRPGDGWPGDPVGPGDLVPPSAAGAGDVVLSAGGLGSLAELDAAVSVCRACPRLVAWREDVAVAKRVAYVGEPYWGRPIVGWGPADALILVVGLAPAAHGGNRTGRIFTGDRSGDWLWAALHRAGLAATGTSVHAGDGQEPLRCRLSMAVHCAPPDNRPTVLERDTCAPWFETELRLLQPTLRVVVALGGFGWTAVLRGARTLGWTVPRPVPRFGHGSEAVLGAPTGDLLLLGCYHPSQQNTFTGRLTEPMLDAVLGRALSAARIRS